MGQGTSVKRTIVLRGEEKIYFKKWSVATDVAGAVKRWEEEAAPLALTVEDFTTILNLGQQGDLAARLFQSFDTDQNRKVDAFELLAAAVVLASGSLVEKLDALLQIFDFSTTGQLGFDEVNILMASICRGLAKTCMVDPEDDEVLIKSCRHCYDGHNLPYDKVLTKEQFKRWVRHDVEICCFVESVQDACALSQLLERLTTIEEGQVAVFQDLCPNGGREVDVGDLSRSTAFRKSFGNLSDQDWTACLGVLAEHSQSVDVERFAEGTRAWNAFQLLDTGEEGKLQPKMLPLLHWLSMPEQEGEPEELGEIELQTKMKSMGLPCDVISRPNWLQTCLLHVG